MSENTPRGTQFAGFAALLAEELKEHRLLNLENSIQMTDPPTDLEYEQVKRIIAKRAYDLACHIINTVDPGLMGYGKDSAWSASNEEIVCTIPDMTEWPGVE